MYLCFMPGKGYDRCHIISKVHVRYISIMMMPMILFRNALAEQHSGSGSGWNIILSQSPPSLCYE